MLFGSPTRRSSEGSNTPLAATRPTRTGTSPRSPASTLGDIQSSVTALAKSQFAQMVTGRLLSSLLIGANQQISGCDCGGGFGSVGSFGLGANGRWSFSDRLTLLAGASYDQFSAEGADVTNAPIAAASLRYDLTDWGKSRPFFEFGAAIAPYMTVSYSRSYANGFVTSTGNGSAIDRSPRCSDAWVGSTGLRRSTKAPSFSIWSAAGSKTAAIRRGSPPSIRSPPP